MSLSYLIFQSLACKGVPFYPIAQKHVHNGTRDTEHEMLQKALAKNCFPCVYARMTHVCVQVCVAQINSGAEELAALRRAATAASAQAEAEAHAEATHG